MAESRQFEDLGELDASSWHHLLIAVMMSFNGNPIAATHFLEKFSRSFTNSYQLAMLQGDLWLQQEHSAHLAYGHYRRASEIAEDVRKFAEYDNGGAGPPTLSISRDELKTYADNAVKYAALQEATALANALARNPSEHAVTRLQARNIERSIGWMKSGMQKLYENRESPAHQDFYYETLATFALLLAGHEKQMKNADPEIYACSLRALSEVESHFRQRLHERCSNGACADPRTEVPKATKWIEASLVWQRFVQNARSDDNSSVRCGNNAYRSTGLTAG